MELRILSDEGDLLHIETVGSKVQPELPKAFAPLDALLGSGGYGQRMMLNLTETRFIDSSGLSWLVVCHKRFIQGNGKLVIHSVRPTIMDLFKMMRLELVLNLAEDEPAARKLMGDEQP
jgi:anti-anti-sigma factor